jgi:hypothetical protein
VSLWSLTLAIHHPADQMLSAEMGNAHACLSSKETHTRDVDQSAYKARTAQGTRPACRESAEILAQELADRVQFVWSAITFLCAAVPQECKAIHLLLVAQYQVN